MTFLKCREHPDGKFCVSGRGSYFVATAGCLEEEVDGSYWFGRVGARVEALLRLREMERNF